MQSYETPTTSVVRAVAELEETDITELEPLYEAIDTNALNVLLDAPGTQIEVTFEYGEYLITVTNGGELTVEECEFTRNPGENPRR
ncbi:HalOD1 output domain-containing protein [Natronococcus occultus]|uniref:HalOD1 output domain-containing protein n=1 Tax=Natronococcus occultus TaxID=29288 RepID=UPI00146163B3|nr:HalOD1 output domain-containing protein [Natronococcus occultus]